ncbi:MAG: cell division protein ZapA [Bacillota bacterium]
MSNDDITRVTVRIMGEEYVLRSDARAEHVRQVARTVNDKMQEISNSQPQLDLPRVAILTALSLADELLRRDKEERRQEPKSEPKNQPRHGRGTPGKH